MTGGISCSSGAAMGRMLSARYRVATGRTRPAQPVGEAEGASPLDQRVQLRKASKPSMSLAFLSNEANGN